MAFSAFGPSVSAVAIGRLSKSAPYLAALARRPHDRSPRTPELQRSPRPGIGKMEIGRPLAKVEWHPGELIPRVGFIVTNLSRPAERVVAFYNKRAGRASNGSRKARVHQVDAVVMLLVRCQRRAAPASCARLQSRQFLAHARNTGADGYRQLGQPERWSRG